MFIKILLFYLLFQVFSPPLTPKEKLYLSLDPFIEEGKIKSPSNLKGTPPIPLEKIKIDMKRYDVYLRLDFNDKSISGSNTITCSAIETGQRNIYLDCMDVEVDSIKTGDSRLEFDYSGEVLSIDWGKDLELGKDIAFTVYYKGKPLDGLFFKRTATNIDICETSSEPIGTRHWIPCQDRPDDKVLISLQIRVPSDYYAASNGLLQGVQDLGTEKIYTWESGYVMSSYLIFLGATKYNQFKQDYKNMGIGYFVYPEHEDTTKTIYRNMPEIMTLFEGKFGEYPFINEKYAMIEVTTRGGMENQTITALGENYYMGNGSAERVAAHELAHQWWGDEVTCGTWYDLWLNESMATFCEMIYYEHFQGEAAMPQIRKKYYDWIMHYLGETERWQQSVYGYHDQTFSYLVYGKGGFVLEMLRMIIGDDAFYTALSKYRSYYKLDVAYTNDLIAAFEHEYGRPLSWFFNQWIYNPGWPIIVYDFAVKNDTLQLYLDQVQRDYHPNIGLFKAPIDVLVKGYNNQEKRYTLWFNGINRNMRKDLYTGFIPREIVLDPDMKLLSEIFYKRAFDIQTKHLALPEGNHLFISPQPSHGDIRITLILGSCERTGIYAYDLNGRRVAILVPEQSFKKGAYSWNKTLSLSSGVYFIAAKGIRLSKPLVLYK